MEEEKKVVEETTDSLVSILSKVQAVYRNCKTAAEQFAYDDVWLNSGHKPSEAMDEWANQVNKTNLYRQKEKDLEFLLVMLQDAKGGQSSGFISAKTVKQLDIYIENVKSLLKVYITIGQIQASILKYYERGGATF